MKLTLKTEPAKKWGGNNQDSLESSSSTRCPKMMSFFALHTLGTIKSASSILLVKKPEWLSVKDDILRFSHGRINDSGGLKNKMKTRNDVLSSPRYYGVLFHAELLK